MQIRNILIFSLFIFIFSNLYSKPFSPVPHKVDTALTKIETIQNDTLKINELLSLSDKISSDKPDKSYIYASEALNLSRKLNYKKGMASAYNNIGIYYYYVGRYNKAIENYIESINIRLELNDTKALSTVYNNLGAAYSFMSNYTNALEYYMKSLKIEEELNNKSGMARSYNNIGIIYYNNSNYSKTLEYFLKAAKIREELNDSLALLGSYNNIGELYRIQKNYSHALEYFFKSMKMSENLNNKRGMAQALMNIGLTYKDLQNFSLSKENIQKSLELKKELHDTQGIAIALQNIASIFKEQGIYNQARDIYQQALVSAEEIQAFDVLRDVYFDLSQIYELTADHENALKYYKLYSSSKDTISNRQNQEKFAEMQTRFDTEQKEQQIKLLKNESELQEANYKRQTLFQYILIIGFVFIIIAATLIYRSYRTIRKTNKKLSEQTQKILDQSVKLELANLKLEKLSIVAKETSNAVAIIDKNGDVEWLNEGFSNIYGYSYEELIAGKGKNIENLSNNPNIKSILAECITKKSSVLYETKALTKWGNKIWIQTALTPIYDDKGNLRMIIAVDSDISVIKKAEEEISLKNKNITDSINYAKRIQDAILLKENEISRTIPGSFIFFKPRDIVSGDFYWISETQGKTLIVCADCTGHGVPGSMMSMIGIMLLNEIVKQKHITQTGEILKRLHKGVLNLLNQDKKDNVSQDGIDLSVCTINYTDGFIEYSGAMCPVYVVKRGMLTVIEPDLRSVGGSLWRNEEANEHTFSTNHIEIEEGMTMYMFTDGYIDQFGGNDNSKFNSSRFKKLLLDIHQFSPDKQKESIETNISAWMKDKRQIDDMLIIGVKF